MGIEAEDYVRSVQQRGALRFWLGLLVRARNYLRHERIRRLARRNGAIVGRNVILPLALARKANANLVIGDDTSIASDDIDLREKVCIGSHVIIGRGVNLTLQSHNVDSVYWETIGNGGLVIEDYVWCATNTMVLPGCRRIGRGAVLGAGAVIVKDVEAMAVMGGNPAKALRQRNAVHSSLVVSAVSSGDLVAYWMARKGLTWDS